MGRKGFEIGAIIKKILKQGSRNRKQLKEEVKEKLGPNSPRRFETTFDQALVKLLEENGEVKLIGYDPLVDSRESKQTLYLDSLIFDLDSKKYSKLHIHSLFKKIESGDINEYDNAETELFKIFEKRFWEYRKWENECFNKFKMCVVCLSSTKIVKELKRINKNKLSFTDSSIDNSVNSYLDNLYIKNQDDSIQKELDFLEKEGYNHVSFIDFESCLENIQVLPPGFPGLRRNYGAVRSNGVMDPEDYLSTCEVRTLPSDPINIKNVYYELIFYMNSHDTNMIRNILINCLSYPKTDGKRLKNLKRFGMILKELGYIKPSFMESIGCDEYGRNKEEKKNDLEELKLLLKRIINS